MPGREFLPAVIAIGEGDGLTIGNLKAPAHTHGRVPIPGFVDPAAAGAGIAKLIITFVRSFERALQIFARAAARIDEAAVAEFAPRVDIEIAPLALHVRTKSSAGIGPFLPGQAEPAQILEHGVNEFGPGALKIQILVAKNKFAACGAGPLVGHPEGSRVAEMKVSGRRRSEAAAIAAVSSQHSAFSPRAFLFAITAFWGWRRLRAEC